MYHQIPGVSSRSIRARGEIPRALFVSRWIGFKRKLAEYRACYTFYMYRISFFRTLFVSVAILVVGLQFNALHFGFASASTPLVDQSAAAIATSASSNSTLAWIESAGYFGLFIAMCVEGPLITAAAAFAAALGYIDIWAVLVLSLLGDIIPDFLYYAIGYFSRASVIERYGHRFGLTHKRMLRLEHLLKTHPIKTLIVTKLVFATPGLMVVGMARMSPRTYGILCALITLPKTLLFMFIGYYFGAAYTTISTYLQNGLYFIVFSVVVVLGMWWLYSKATTIISNRLETV
jgi:membrane-associated protein